MVDVIVTRLLPGVLFGFATGGLLWLIGLVRKRAALACATALALIFLAGRWDATFLLTAQIALTAAAGLALRPGQRLRMRDIVALATAAVVAAWGLFLLEGDVYWRTALVAGLAGASGAWIARAASERWPASRVRLLTLRATDAGGISGPGTIAGLLLAIVVVALSTRLGSIGPGEQALVVAGAAVGTTAADFATRGQPGFVLIAGFAAAATAAGLVAFLP